MIDARLSGQLLYKTIVASFKLYNFLGSDGFILLGRSSMLVQ